MQHLLSKYNALSLAIILFTLPVHIFAQTCGSCMNSYFANLVEADSLRRHGNFLDAAYRYSEAFSIEEVKPLKEDYYNAALLYAMSGQVDSSIHYLSVLEEKYNYGEYDLLRGDSSFHKVYYNNKSEAVFNKIKANQDNQAMLINRSLRDTLERIFEDDQRVRQMPENTNVVVGVHESFVARIERQDSINLGKVAKIIEKHGWVGKEEVGKKANDALFLVIQHSDDPDTLENYLPILEKAVKEGKAEKKHLAYIVDRIAHILGSIKDSTIFD